jgi:hypothetical protein
MIESNEHATQVAERFLPSRRSRRTITLADSQTRSAERLTQLQRAVDAEPEDSPRLPGMLERLGREITTSKTLSKMRGEK